MFANISRLFTNETEFVCAYIHIHAYFDVEEGLNGICFKIIYVVNFEKNEGKKLLANCYSLKMVENLGQI